MKDRINVFIVDDESIVIDRLKIILEETNEFKVVGWANQGSDETVKNIMSHTCDIVIVDLELAGRRNMNGVEIIKQCRTNYDQLPEPHPKFVLYTHYYDFATIKEAIQLQTSVIGKNIDFQVLLQQLRNINSYPNYRVDFIDDGASPIPDPTYGLDLALERLFSPIQIRIACMTWKGMDAKSIAKELKQGANFVNNQRRIMYEVLEDLVKDKEVNLAILSAVMERSGLCGKLELKDFRYLLED